MFQRFWPVVGYKGKGDGLANDVDMPVLSRNRNRNKHLFRDGPAGAPRNRAIRGFVGPGNGPDYPKIHDPDNGVVVGCRISRSPAGSENRARARLSFMQLGHAKLGQSIRSFMARATGPAGRQEFHWSGHPKLHVSGPDYVQWRQAARSRAGPARLRLHGPGRRFSNRLVCLRRIQDWPNAQEMCYFRSNRPTSLVFKPPSIPEVTRSFAYPPRKRRSIHCPLSFFR